MARGGSRPGAGRKRKVRIPVVQPGATPLDYMMAVMRDETATPARRDRMALAAAPFVHQRMSPTIPDGDERPPTGKKAVAARAARNPDESTPMGALLKRRGGLK